MGKVHQLLAVEKDIVGKAAAILQETLVSFTKKATELYTGVIKTYTPYDAEGEKVNPEERLLVDTVPSKLNYTADALVAEYDFLLQKEASNAVAKADLVVDGKTLGAGLPVTFLLTLERRLEKLRQVIESAPTLPNGFAWVPDTATGKNVYKLEKPIETYRSLKVPYAFVKAPATVQHPAQVVEKEENKTVGVYTEMRTDSRVTSAQKSVWLGNLDAVLLATRKAIRVANDIDTVDGKIGQQIFDAILA